jgi:hypothetical protein
LKSPSGVGGPLGEAGTLNPVKRMNYYD